MSIEVGGVVEGTVTGITKFGAFVDLTDGKVGLVHISEVADVYVNDVKDFLKVGQKVKVKILSVDDHGKIGLSIKRLQPKKPEAPAGMPAQSSSPARRPVGNDFRGRPAGRYPAGPVSFEDKLSKFLKDSDERLTDLRRKTDSKRGGRGSRRSG
ncbi:MAG: RNA-binding protein S1 [Schwartzia succinivorans]|nr:RNA-binding protein S1 [Schwartzia succinivorans]